LRLRPEWGAGLCPCSCHSSCPVTPTARRMTVPMRTWHASCTCPGAERERRAMDEAGAKVPDFGELWEEKQRRSRARKEAFQAARGRVAGMSRAQIREAYVAELRARGLKVPDEAVLDAVVDHIGGNPVPAALVAGESLVQLGKSLHGLIRLFRLFRPAGQPPAEDR
jgi:hypothetical protein